MPSLLRETVYVGVSAGSMAVAATFGETYLDPRRGSGEALTSEDIVFATPQGEISRILVTAQGVYTVLPRYLLIQVVPCLSHSGPLFARVMRSGGFHLESDGTVLVFEVKPTKGTFSVTRHLF